MSRQRLPDWWLFLQKFLRQGTRVGSVTPSSPWFARRLLEGIDLKQARCVVELGAGTGAVTRELLRRASASCRCLIVERDADFCVRLREHFPRAEIVEADACDLDALLRSRGVERVDHVVSGLALPWFTPAARHKVLDASRRCLTLSGSFRQLTYIPWVHAPMYRRYFERADFRWVFWNVPPGGFYECCRPRPEGPRDEGPSFP
ncbi:MAG: methyltransferase domain-containing protein [Gemmataceae bacterium]